jgi:G:T-mismatch repair DNA endonuclease (very short patch repair protein)
MRKTCVCSRRLRLTLFAEGITYRSHDTDLQFSAGVGSYDWVR